MDNTKTTRTAKNLDILANVGGKIASGAGIACIILSVLTLIFGEKMFSAGDLTLNLDCITLHLSGAADVRQCLITAYVCAATLGGGALCLLVSYVCKLFRQILAPMKDGRPFESGTAVSLRKIGWAVLVGGLASQLLGVTAWVLLVKAYSIETLFASDAITKTEFVFTVNFGFVLVACVMFLLSYIFSYGQALQQEADETL